MRWIEGTDWRAVLVLSFISSFTLSLVFAGTVNDSVDQQKIAKVQSGEIAERDTQSLSVPVHSQLSKPLFEKGT